MEKSTLLMVFFVSLLDRAGSAPKRNVQIAQNRSLKFGGDPVKKRKKVMMFPGNYAIIPIGKRASQCPRKRSNYEKYFVFPHTEGDVRVY